jgi:biotin carboxylase
VLERSDDAETALAEIGLPCIVKPADSSGSRGVVTVTDGKEASAAIRAALELSRRVLLERPLEGLHLDVNGFFRDGAFVPGGLLERFFSPPPHHVPLWGLQPARLSTGQTREVYDLLERAARALGIHVGPVKADVVWCASGPALLELAPRFHGDVSTAHVTPLAHGKSPIQAWFATLAGAGGPFDDQPITAGSAAGWMAIFPDETGELAEVAGLEAAQRLPGIAAVTLLRPHGHTITNLTDNTSVCGFLWATGRDAAEVESRLRAARALIEVKMAWRSAA